MSRAMADDGALGHRAQVAEAGAARRGRIDEDVHVEGHGGLLRTSKVLPAKAGILPRPRIMAASASAAGYCEMSGALRPRVSAPPRPVALWQPAQYRR